MEGTTDKDAEGAQRHLDAYAFASFPLRPPATWYLRNSILRDDKSDEQVVEGVILSAVSARLRCMRFPPRDGKARTVAVIFRLEFVVLRLE